LTASHTRVGPHLPHLVEGLQDGPVIVFINSIGMTMPIWDTQVPELSPRMKVVRYNQRGHEGAPVPDGPYSLADLGTDLIDLMDSLGLERASICGLSLGGLVAMWTAAHAPDRIDRLVVACSSARPADPAKWSSRATLARTAGVPAVIAQSSLGWFTPEFAHAHADVLERLRAAAGRTPSEGYAGCCDALRTADVIDDLPSIAAPTLVIAGERDRGFPLDHARAVQQGIAGSELVVLPDTAHIAPVESPAAFGAALRHHLGFPEPATTEGVSA
jgi:3-oxoadipate enol-lactonase